MQWLEGKGVTSDPDHYKGESLTSIPVHLLRTLREWYSRPYTYTQTILLFPVETVKM